MDGIIFSNDKKLLQLPVIHGFLCNESYWCPEIPISLVEQSIENSFCIGAYNQLGEQIGFARLITDYATFGYLADVFVLPKYRGKGISKGILSHIFAQDWVHGLRRLMLATRDAHSLYDKYGFKRVDNPDPLMQIVKPDLYRNAETKNLEL